MPPKNHRRGTPTDRQIKIFRRYSAEPDYRGKLSRIAEEFGITPANLLKALKAYERNVLLERGYAVPTLKQLVTKGHTASANDNDQEFKKLRLIVRDGVALSPLEADPPRNAPFAFSELEEDEIEEEVIQPRDVFNRGRDSFRRRYIQLPKKKPMAIFVTGAQDSTIIHEKFLRQMETYREWYDEWTERTEIFVTGATYNKKVFGAYHEKKDAHFLSHGELYALEDKVLSKLVFFDSRIEKYWSEERIHIAKKVDICCETNIIPTATRPLSEFQDYIDSEWGVFGHPRQHLESVGRLPGQPHKANISTGYCTVPNYIAKKSGQKAERQHKIGFVVIEVHPNGTYFVRRIQADPVTGNFHDLDRYVDEKGVHTGISVAVMAFGDIHREKLCPLVAKATWGYDSKKNRNVPGWMRHSLVDMLRPEHMMFHDTFDMSARNHHSRNDPHWRWNNFFNGQESIEEDLKDIANFLACTARPYAASVVVRSNHDDAFKRYLAEVDPRRDDVINTGIWLKGNLAIWEHAEKGGDPNFNIFGAMVRSYAPSGKIDHVTFLDGHTSYEVLGREFGMHGDKGPNGSRGSSVGFYRIALRMVKGHDHTPSILDETISNGCCNLLQGYNEGTPTTWDIAHSITHHDGTVQLLHMRNGAFFLRRPERLRKST